MSTFCVSFINQKNASIAVQKAIGVFSGNIKTIYYLQLAILLVLITVFSYGLSFFLIPIVDKYISDGLGLNIDFSGMCRLIHMYVYGTLSLFYKQQFL